MTLGSHRHPSTINTHQIALTLSAQQKNNNREENCAQSHLHQLRVKSMEEHFGLVKGAIFFLLFLPALAIMYFWISYSILRTRLQRNGFQGPPPCFPLGNLMEMYKKVDKPSSSSSSSSSSPANQCSAPISHDIHSTVFPCFARWRKVYGKTFIYWLGTEPLLYVEDPEILRKVSNGEMEKKWGKPDVFKRDRKPMFGKGLLMVEGDSWSRLRHIIAPAFSTANLNKMIAMMEDSTTKMLENWINKVKIGADEIDVEKEMTMNAAEIIAKASFGISHGEGREVFQKLQDMQIMLFRTGRLVGVPFSKFFSPVQSYRAWKLGKEIDELLLDIISSRKEEGRVGDDLLGLLLAAEEEEGERKLTIHELVDECKTFFFGGHETTALALTWTLLLLALYPDWQKLLREEMAEVSEGEPLTSDMLPKLIKMKWVWNEVLRLYSPAPNSQRQAREEIVADEIVVPKGANMWVDAVGLHHDKDLWGDDANEFKPERFKAGVNGGCKQRMGYLPFGFGGRICIGRNLSLMEYKIVLCLILRKFSVSVSPTYVHSPRVMLSLRPSHGVPLIFHLLG